MVETAGMAKAPTTPVETTTDRFRADVTSGAVAHSVSRGEPASRPGRPAQPHARNPLVVYFDDEVRIEGVAVEQIEARRPRDLASVGPLLAQEDFWQRQLRRLFD